MKKRMELPQKMRFKILVLCLACTMTALLLQTWLFNRKSSTLIYNQAKKESFSLLQNMQDDLFTILKSMENNIIKVYNRQQLIRDLKEKESISLLRDKYYRESYNIAMECFDTSDGVVALYLYNGEDEIISTYRRAVTPRHNYPLDIYENAEENNADLVRQYAHSNHPNMKLEKSVIDRRVRLMEEEGVIFKTNVNVGVDVKAAKLLKDFDRVVLCCGASNPRDIKVPGREAEGIYFAVDFLKGVTKSLLDSDLADQKFVACKNKKVMVIGGGDTGNDCVGTAIRLGASSVVQLEMMPKAPEQRAANNPWPEWPRVCKTDYGQQEAIAVFGHDPRIYQTAVKEFIADDKGRLKKAVLVKLQSKKDEKTGRMMMVPVEGSEWTVEVDIVLIAAGFLGSQKYVTDAFKVDLTPRTNVATEAEKYQTSVKNVFTAGDMHRGQSLVVWAIHEGREAAKAVDESLMGYTNLV